MTLHTHDSFATKTIDFSAITDTSMLPQPVTPPIEQSTYKARTEDFIVNEILDIDFTGEGEHLWLQIQKSGMNTAYLAKLLSEWADIPLRDIGYSGLKDRQALTTQWFSLRLPKKQLPATDFLPSDIKDNESIKILAQHWHNKKLNRGTHRANQFTITLSKVTFSKVTLQEVPFTDADKSTVDTHLQNISKHGVPNYFGSQRFGHSGNNIKEALALFTRPLTQKPAQQTQQKRGKQKRAPRERNAMELSAARSLIFNEILATRVRDGSWNTGLDGEVFNLNGSGSIFASESTDEALQARLAANDIHPTGVLWGAGNDKVAGKAAQLEQDVVQQSELLAYFASNLEQREIKAQRRALRLLVEDLVWEWRDKCTDKQTDKQIAQQTLILSFTLTTGSFATSVLASLVRQLV